MMVQCQSAGISGRSVKYFVHAIINDSVNGLCIMDATRPTKCPDYQDVLVFQVILYDRHHLGP